MGVSPATHDSSLEDRVSRLEETVSRLVAALEPALAVSDIAAPIAQPLLKEGGQHQDSAKFMALLDVGESLIKYSTAIGFAAAFENDWPIRENISAMFLGKPTLGKLVEAFRSVLSQGKDVWPVDILRRVFVQGSGNKPTPTARYLFDEFISVRNKERGHGAQLPDGYYERLYLNHHLTVHDCAAECVHIRLPLVHIHSLDHAGDKYSYKVTALMGAAPTKSPMPILSNQKVRVGSTCLWDRGERLLSLRDFVIYKYCEQCNSEHVFFVEHIGEKKIEWHSYYGNHRTDKAMVAGE